VRWLTLLLLAVNLVLFGVYWQQEQQAQRTLARQQRVPEAPSIGLLAEASQLLVRASAPALSALAPDPPEPAMSSAGGGSETPERASQALPSRGIPAEEGLLGDAVVAPLAVVPSLAAGESPSDASASAVSMAAVATPVEPVVEAEGEGRVEPAAEPAVAATMPAKGDKPAPLSVCYRLAYFDTRRDAERSVAALEQQRLVIDEERRELAPDFWVYILDPGRSALRRAMRKELSDMGFENYWIQRGPLKGQLSLGLYRNQESAEALQQLLQGRGYAVRIFEKTRYSVRYLVDIALQSTTAAEGRWLAGLSTAYPLIKSEKKPCQGLASADAAE